MDILQGLEKRASPQSTIPLLVCGTLVLALNVGLAMVIRHVLHTPGYRRTGRVWGALPWALVVNLCFAGLTLIFAQFGKWRGQLGRVLAAVILVAGVPFLLPRALRIYKAEWLYTLGLVYAIFLLLIVLVATWYALANAPWASRRSLRIWILAVTTLVYAGTTGWMRVSTGVTGDEPHYLLLTHSLVHDHDFDLTNNYAHKDYRAFYPYDMFPQTVPGRNGTAMLWHDVGLPLMLTVGYSVAGHTGAMVVVNVLTALVALGLFEAALELGGTRSSAIVVWALFSFSAPLIIYASQIYPETAGVGGTLWAVVLFARFMRTERTCWLWGAGVLVAVLPWLCIRYWMFAGPLVVVIALFILVRLRDRDRVISGLTALVLPLAISLGLFAWFDAQHFGTILPNAGYLRVAKSYPQYVHVQPVQGMLGLLFDRLEGIIPIAPIYLCAIGGLIAVSKKSRWLVAALLSAAVASLVFMAFSQYWTGGWCPPARYALGPGVLCAPATALVLQRRLQRWMLGIAALWSTIAAICYTAAPALRYPYRPDLTTSSWDLFVRQRLGFDFDVVFPSMIRSSRMDYCLGAIWICAAAAWVWLLNRREAELSRP